MLSWELRSRKKVLLGMHSVRYTSGEACQWTGLSQSKLSLG